MYTRASLFTNYEKTFASLEDIHFPNVISRRKCYQPSLASQRRLCRIANYWIIANSTRNQPAIHLLPNGWTVTITRPTRRIP